MSSERLKRIHTAVEAAVKENKVPGAVTLVMRRGKTAYLDAVGMPPDTIFRIASMTKAVTSVAIMILNEDGKLLLTDPVSKFIPEFKGPQVAVLGEDKKSFTLVPAKSEITIRHLLTHTSGITYKFINAEPWARLYTEAGVIDGLQESTGLLSITSERLRSFL